MDRKCESGRATGAGLRPALARFGGHRRRGRRRRGPGRAGTPATDGREGGVRRIPSGCAPRHPGGGAAGREAESDRPGRSTPGRPSDKRRSSRVPLSGSRRTDDTPRAAWATVPGGSGPGGLAGRGRTARGRDGADGGSRDRSWICGPSERACNERVFQTVQRSGRLKNVPVPDRWRSAITCTHLTALPVTLCKGIPPLLPFRIASLQSLFPLLPD